MKGDWKSPPVPNQGLRVKLRGGEEASGCAAALRPPPAAPRRVALLPAVVGLTRILCPRAPGAQGPRAPGPGTARLSRPPTCRQQAPPARPLALRTCAPHLRTAPAPPRQPEAGAAPPPPAQPLPPVPLGEPERFSRYKSVSRLLSINRPEGARTSSLAVHGRPVQQWRVPAGRGRDT